MGKNSTSDVQPSGLGGWLILVGIGLIFAPIRLIVHVIQTYPSIFRDGAWQTLATPGSDLYHPLWAPLLIGEIVGNAMFIAAGIALVVLFFRRSSRFPKFYLALMVASVVFILANAWLVTLVLPTEAIFDAETATEFWRSAITLAVWGPYLMVSKRVKNTFNR